MLKKIIVFSLIFLIGFGFLTGCGSISRKQNKVSFTKDGVAHFENGYLYRKEGVPFLYLKGSSYNMGLQYGVLLKEQINSVYSKLDHLEKSVFANLPVYLRPLITIFIFVKLIYIKHSLPYEFKNEIRGISDGSGVSYNKLLLISMLPEIFNFSCTSFVKIVSGRLIHGRNLDYYFPLIGKNPLVVRYVPSGKIPYTLVGCVGYTGAYTGMNDYGITLTVDAAPIVDTNKESALPVTFEIRDILENARNFSDVEKFLKSYRSIKGWMVIAGSASEKKGAVFNIAGKNVSETPMEDGKIFVTNTFADKDFAHKFMALSDAESASSVCRYERFSRLIGNINSVDSAIEALSDIRFYNYGEVIGAGDVTVNNEGSLQTVVMDPSNHSIYFSSSSVGMYSGFDKFVKTDALFRDMSVLYKEPNYKILNSSYFKNFSDWFTKAETYYLEGNYKKALNTVKGINKPNLIQLEGEENVAEKLGILCKDTSLIEKSDFLIGKYPEYIMPYLVKAKVLYASGKYTQTLDTCNQALKTHIKPLYLETEIYSLLALSYEKTGKTDLAKENAKRTISIIKNYAIGPKEAKILNKMKEILSK